MRSKSRLFIMIAGILAALLGFSAPALASGLHWFQGQTPYFTESSTGSSATVTAAGEVAGAGTFIVVTLTVNYSFPVSCFNPGNDAGPVPGQTQSGSSSTTSPEIPAVHGNASFDVSETVTATASSSACPNSSWTAVAGPLTVTSATVMVNSSNSGTLTSTATSFTSFGS